MAFLPVLGGCGFPMRVKNPLQDLLGHIDHAAATIADFLQQLVAAEGLSHGFVGRMCQLELDGGTGLPRRSF